VQGPEPLLEGLGLAFRDPVRPTRVAKLDPAHRAWIGQDAFYFASRDSREHFLHDPLRYCPALTDPVTERRFHPTRRSPRMEYNRRPYYFSSDSTLARFRARPEFYATRGPMDEMRRMLPEHGAAH
jgi:YHS domain-containing protein